jgi:hypothetical protein
MAEIDYEAIAKQFGGTTTPAPALASASTPSAGGVDYESLAKQFGGTTTTMQMPSAADEGMPSPQRTEMDPYAIRNRAIVGAAAGATTPELTALLGKGLQMVPYTPVRMAGKALEAGAPFMKTVSGRVLPAVYGLLGGGSGETLKQTLEIGGVRPSVANLAGMGVEVATQPLGDIAASLAKRIPALSTAVAGVAEDMGVNLSKLSSAETKIVAQEIARLRGDAPDAAGALYQELEKGAGRIVSEADAAALARQTKAASDYTAKITAAGKIPSEADTLVAKSKARVHDIGNADTELTDIGTRQRKAISDRFSEENLARDQEYKNLKAERDTAVADRENAGDFISRMPEYKQLTDQLDKVLLKGNLPAGVSTAPETEKSTLSAFGEIRDALKPRTVQLKDAAEAQALKAQGVQVMQKGDEFFRVYQPSFNAIDTVRRKLGDVAFGQGEEGFKAIGQARAKEWYGKLSDLQSKYAGDVQDELQGGYEAASGLLERFKGGAGAKILKTERLSPDMYSKDPKDVPASFFKSRDGVAQLSAISKDPALVEQTAGDYVARNLKGKSADEAERWLRSNSDFLSAPELKNVTQKAVDYVDQLRGVEGKTTGMLAGAKAKEASAKESLNLGVAEAKDIAAQGRTTAKNILADRFGVDRVNSLLDSTRKSEWESVANALGTSAKGRDLLSQSLEQRLATIADDALKANKPITASAALDKITEPLLATGLVDQAKIASFKAQLAKIEKPETAKLTWLTTQGLRSLFSGVVPSLPAFATSLTSSNALAPPNQNSLAGQ